MQSFTVIVHEEDDKADGFWAEVQELPGCFGAGETLAELKTDIREAIELYLQILKDEGCALPASKTIEEPEFLRWHMTVPELVETE